ncbi:MAG: transglycosylase SLT domain-containing protein [Planctomycetota bacterium]
MSHSGEPVDAPGGHAGRRTGRRELLLGAAFAALAVVGVPAVGLFAGGPRAAYARLQDAPLVGPVLEAWRARVDEAALDDVEALAELLVPAAREADVEPALLGAIVWAESRGRSGQRSSAGALGLAQLVPAAARDAARRAGIEVPEDPAELEERLLHDDRLNLRLGAVHLAWLLEHRGEWTLEAVLVSYNAGRARLFSWIERHGSYEAWTESELNRAAAGERTTGALRYARQVLGVRDRLAARARLR